MSVVTLQCTAWSLTRQCQECRDGDTTHLRQMEACCCAPCSVCSAALCHDVITWCVIVAECGGWPGGWSGCGGGSAILTAVGAVTADCGGWTKTGAGVSLPGPGPGHQPPEPELPLLRHIPLAEAAVRRPAAGEEIEAMTDICQR